MPILSKCYKSRSYKAQRIDTHFINHKRLCVFIFRIPNPALYTRCSKHTFSSWNPESYLYVAEMNSCEVTHRIVKGARIRLQVYWVSSSNMLRYALKRIIVYSPFGKRQQILPVFYGHAVGLEVSRFISRQTARIPLSFRRIVENLGSLG